MESFHRFQAQTSPFPFGLEVEKAEGVYIYDRFGKKYLDFISGVSVSNIGHCHPKVVTAVQNQVEKYMHTMVYGEYVQSPQTQLAKKLCQLLPEQLNSVYFVNSGTEANEGALKLAKRITGRTQLISCHKSYHGSTHGSLSVSGNEYKKFAFRPLLPDVDFMNFNSIDDLNLITNRTAAVIIEPIQGDAGVRIPDVNYLKALRQRCNETGAMLIFDEIQTGFGRTGKLFAFEHYNVVPDFLTIAKGMGGGMPIGAFISSKANMHKNTFDPMLGHITTFGGHPVNCAAALANIEVLTDGKLLKEAENKGALIEKLLQHDKVVEIRRKGLFFAIEMKSFEIVNQVVEYCMDKGVIGFWFLSCTNSFRIAPPLIINEKEINEACQVIKEAFNELK